MCQHLAMADQIVVGVGDPPFDMRQVHLRDLLCERPVQPVEAGRGPWLRRDALRAVEDEINARPRMVLADRTPSDLFEALPASPDQQPLRR